MTLSAVIDANVVIGLSKGNVFSLLPRLFRPLYVPQSVKHEVIDLGRERPGSMELQQALAEGWIVLAVPHLKSDRRSPDQETVEAAKSYSADYVLTGDVEVARMAQEAGFKHLSAPEIVAVLKMAGHVPSAMSILDSMSRNGFGIDPADRQVILRLVGEE